MARIRKKSSRSLPAITTASLPDIVFMLIFFFVVAAKIRDTKPLVKVSPPKATMIEKLEKKYPVSYIYVGRPVDRAKYGTAPRIQLDDTFASLESIGPFINIERNKLSEAKKDVLIVSLKADRGVTMGIITDVKQELRKAEALKLNYSSIQRVETY
jgi:biopolymer transport protein ExbD